MSMGLVWQTITTSSEDTAKLGELLGSQLKGGEVIELRSDLGGGKTTFVKGLVCGAGSKDLVTSPTFTLSRVYQAKNFPIYHFDFYRLNNPGIMADQLTESINDSNVVVIEWADIVHNVLPENHISIEFKPTLKSSTERQVIISYRQNQEELIAPIQTQWQESRP
jgi:tRNA threonylcarbamoyladenosine biosynthesis protein TsaE